METRLACLNDAVYRPIRENQAFYGALYSEYLRLDDYFGRIQNEAMRKLKEIKFQALKR
jgi:L-ribulokinase